MFLVEDIFHDQNANVNVERMEVGAGGGPERQKCAEDMFTLMLPHLSWLVLPKPKSLQRSVGQMGSCEKARSLPIAVCSLCILQ